MEIVKEKRSEIKNLISEGQLKSIRDDLIFKHSDLIVKGLVDPKVRKELKEIIKLDYKNTIFNDELVELVVRESVGTGVIEEILENEVEVTDISYNGTFLVIETNSEKKLYKGKQDITEEYIERIVTKFANATGQDFTPKNPNLSAVFGELRLDAVHSSKSSIGKTTMSLRVVRPKLVLNDSNFDQFAPKELIGFLKNIMKLRRNIVISGEPGTGKTELHKFFVNYISFEDKIIMIEDVPETHLKELFPEKDIFSWLADGSSDNWSISKGVKAAVRNHPKWTMVAETRDEAAFELLQAVYSGSSVITSLHTINARTIPKRLVKMAQMGYQVSEEMESEIRTYIHLGFHLKKRTINNKKIRYLSEIVCFDPVQDTTIFEQHIKDGKLVGQTFTLPEKMKLDFEEIELSSDFIENQKFEREII